MVIFFPVRKLFTSWPGRVPQKHSPGNPGGWKSRGENPVAISTNQPGLYAKNGKVWMSWSMKTQKPFINHSLTGKTRKTVHHSSHQRSSKRVTSLENPNYQRVTSKTIHHQNHYSTVKGVVIEAINKAGSGSRIKWADGPWSCWENKTSERNWALFTYPQDISKKQIPMKLISHLDTNYGVLFSLTNSMAHLSPSPVLGFFALQEAQHFLLRFLEHPIRRQPPGLARDQSLGVFGRWEIHGKRLGRCW